MPRLSSSRRNFAFSASAAAGTLLPGHLLPAVAPSLAPLLLALVLLHTADQASRDADDETDPLPLSSVVPYRVAPVQGAGLGAIAARDIERGEIIITDAPLLIWPQDLSNDEANDLAARLLPEAQKRFYALSNAQPFDKGLNDVLGKRATNAFAVQVPTVLEDVKASVDLEGHPGRISFLYPNIARINHSCIPCADHAIDYSSLRMSVYASSPIYKDQEIAIEYLPMLLLPQAARQEVLEKNFGFRCQCRACGASSEERARSDERRLQIGKIVDRIADVGSKGTADSRRMVIEGFERIRLLLEEEDYRALPDFGSEIVSRAYVLWTANRSQFGISPDEERSV